MTAATGPEEAIREARRLLRAMPAASLATLDGDGFPYAAVVTPATDVDGAPLLFVSDLARHTRHLRRDPRAALLIDGTRDLATPLAGPRMTLTGRAVPADDPRTRDRYLRLRPEAGRLRALGDFHAWRLEVVRVHLVLGFGRVMDPDPARLLHPPEEVAALAAAEAELVAELDGEHADLVQLLAARLLGEAGGDWHLVGIDPEGFTLRHRQRVRRLEVERPIRDPEAARAAFLELVRRTRARTAEP